MIRGFWSLASTLTRLLKGCAVGNLYFINKFNDIERLYFLDFISVVLGPIMRCGDLSMQADSTSDMLPSCSFLSISFSGSGLQVVQVRTKDPPCRNTIWARYSPIAYYVRLTINPTVRFSPSLTDSAKLFLRWQLTYWDPELLHRLYTGAYTHSSARQQKVTNLLFPMERYNVLVPEDLWDPQQLLWLILLQFHPWLYIWHVCFLESPLECLCFCLQLARPQFISYYILRSSQSFFCTLMYHFTTSTPLPSSPHIILAFYHCQLRIYFYRI